MIITIMMIIINIYMYIFECCPSLVESPFWSVLHFLVPWQKKSLGLSLHRGCLGDRAAAGLAR